MKYRMKVTILFEALIMLTSCFLLQGQEAPVKGEVSGEKTQAAPSAAAGQSTQVTAPTVEVKPPAGIVESITKEPAKPEKAPAPELPAKAEARERKKEVGTETKSEAEELSAIEAVLTRGTSFQVSTRIKQFGYDMFKLPSTTFAPVENIPVGPDYIVGPGDSFNIYIWGNIQQVLSVTVDRDGKIALPEVGVLTVWGLAYSQAEKLIKDALAGAYANVQIDVSMGKLRTIRVFVLGEVAKPGGYTLSSLATLFQALYEAGGPTKLGSLRKIRLLRNNKLVDEVDLYKFLLQGEKNQDYRLFSDDVIFIPPIGTVAGIAGCVKKPAIYELLGPTRISDLITLSGGIIPIAYLHRLQVERIKAHEKRILLDLEFKDPSEIKTSTNNLVLQDGDLVYIHPILPYKRNWVAIEGNVVRPGEYQFTEGMRISDLIRKAEGVLPEAYERAEILRYISEHTRQPIPFNIEKILKGEKEEDYFLKEWDIVKVYSWYDIYPEPMVEIKGSVNKPGIYRFTQNMKLSDLLFRGENLGKEAYLERAELYRLRKDKTREMKVVNLREVMEGKEGADILLEPWDKLLVYSLYDIYPTGYVGIEGAVNKPGNYELTKGMKVSDLLFQANYLQKDAYLARAELFRLRKDKKQEVIAINLTKVLQGDEKENILLEEKDVLKVYNVSEIIPKSYVEISGAVYQPGRYELSEDMRISDLLFRAKGLKKVAARIAELYRQRPGTVPEVMKIDLGTIETNRESDLLLQEDDHLFVRYETEWVEKNIISLSGEVVRPGEYVIQKGESLLDVIKRAGGFTEKAYLPAAVFTRQSVKELQKKYIKEFMETEQRKIMEEEANLAGVSLTEAEKRQRVESIQYRKRILESLAQTDVPGRIVLNLPQIIEKKTKILLEHGDILHIPQIPSSVQIVGAVVNAGAVLYEPGKDVYYYLSRLGGPTKFADIRSMYVIRASGEVVSDLRKFKDRIERGDTIVVPEEYRLRTPAGLLVRDIAQIFYQLALPVAAMVK